MAVEAITEDSIREALRSIRAGRSLARSPLLQLDQITIALREEGLSDTRRTREWQVGVALERAMLDELTARAGPLPPSGRSVTSDEWLDYLRQAYESGRRDIEALAYLYCRYLGHLTDAYPVGELAAALGVTARTLQKRLEHGCSLLAAALRERELAATATLRQSVPPPSAMAGGNLPVPATSFIGREAEMCAVAEALGRSRLVTIVGPGGAGKTRLAVEVAAQQASRQPEGVWFVDFASLPLGAAVADEVAAVLGLRREPASAAETAVADQLADRHLLLVLDNCEHVLAGCATLAAAILRRCRQVRLLATSREALQVRGETVFRLAPLLVPGEAAADRASETSLAANPAVQLFVDRAAARRPGFELNEANVGPVSEICRAVDGLPLAIEIAASLAAAMTPSEILNRLRECLFEVDGRVRDAPLQHRSLRAAMEWSYRLLSPAAQAFLARCSVFAGSWSLDAAEQICVGGAVESRNVVPLVLELVDKSLLLAEGENHAGRYRLLATVQQFAAAKLDETDDPATWANRHLAYYMDWAETVAPELEAIGRPEEMARLSREHANLRRAFEWAVATDQAPAAVRLAAALWRYQYRRGHWTEALRWLATATGMAELIGDDAAVVRACIGYAHLLSASGDQAGAQEVAERALAMAGRIGDGALRASALITLGTIAYRRGDRELAERRYGECLVASRDLGDQHGVSNALNNLGLVARWAGRDEEAVAHYQEALAIALDIGDLAGAAATRLNLAGLLHSRGQADAALPLCRDALATFRELGDLHGSAMALHNLANLAAERGDLDQARLLYEQSLALRRRMGNRLGVASTACALASVCADVGDRRGARELLAEGLDIYATLGSRSGLIDAVEGLARIGLAEGAGELAARLLGWAEARRSELGLTRSLPEETAVQQLQRQAEELLGSDAFQRALADGAGLTQSQVVRLARGLADRRWRSVADRLS